MNEEQRADNAKRILDDPLVQEAFDTLRQEFLDRWENSPAQDTDARETLWLGLKILSRLEAHFESLIASGQMAKAQRDSKILF